MSCRSTSTLARHFIEVPTRPTSLKLMSDAPAAGQLILRTISQKQRQLRLGVSSLVVSSGSGSGSGVTGGKKTENNGSKMYISRNTCYSPSQFSPYSPHSRTSMLLNNNSGRTSSGATAVANSSTGPSPHAAQIHPLRLTSRQSSRPCSRATAVPVPPPTSPGNALI